VAGARLQRRRLRDAVREIPGSTTPQPNLSGAQAGDAEVAPFEGRFPGITGSLREHTARGTIINAAFQVSLAVLTLLRRTLVAAFLTPSQLGIWGIVVVLLITLMFIKNAGIGDKFIQQNEPDQEAAFQKAFTIELLLTLVFVAFAAALLPVFGVIYGQGSIVLPGLVLLLAMIGDSFQAPTWIFNRQMNFVRQRTLDAVDPCVTFVVTIGLAIAGASYWSLVIGMVVGSWTGALVSVLFSPYRLAIRIDRATVREYFQFSWPLVVAQTGGLVIAQGSVLVGSRTIGLAGVGAIGLAASIVAFADGVDGIVTQTIYPAICAVRNRADLMLETFIKSNRIALMWGVPFGLGLTLFAGDFVHFVLGDKWHAAIFVMQIFGIIAAISQIGFNWAAFLRARNQTRPLAIVGAISAGAFLTITVPMLLLGGLHGYAIGMLAGSVISLCTRTYFLSKLFDGFQMIWHAARAIAPSLVPVALILAMRLLENGDRTLFTAISELIVYVGATIVATIILERALLREIVGYLRRRPSVVATVD
jgi:O-antigen/teichoic acid export membrane protein